ncbi:MAG: DUF2863 family protein [Janthinobacterium lividum]
MRARTTKRLPPDAEKLVGFSLALYASGSRIEDRFWELKIDELIVKLLRNGSQPTLDAALDQLQLEHPDAYGALADLIETRSESATLDYAGAQWDTLLIAAPVLAWTRYSISSGLLKSAVVDALAAHMSTQLLGRQARIAVAPYLYSIDQLPRHHVDTWRLNTQLAQAALSGQPPRLPGGDLPEAAPILADPRFLLAAIAAPTGAALFHWQEEENGARIERQQCLEQWRVQVRGDLAAILPGCEIDCLLPDAYHAACRDADEAIRPHMLRTAVSHLTDTLDIAAGDLRAVIGGFGERRIEEYRIGFTRRASNDVIYGVVWPLYGREIGEGSAHEDFSVDAPPETPLETVINLLKETGVSDFRQHPGLHEPEHCDDCGTPLYLDPMGDVVHAEMPDDAEPTRPHFH